MGQLAPARIARYPNGGNGLGWGDIVAWGEGGRFRQPKQFGDGFAGRD
jgi:hypothetical protein